jgi:hypothetical protein
VPAACPRAGDLLAIFPQQPKEAVGQVLARLTLPQQLQEAAGQLPAPADAWVRVRPSSSSGPAAGAAADASACTEAGAEVVVQLRALLAGLLDVSSAVPRRYFFQARAGGHLRHLHQ